MTDPINPADITNIARLRELMEKRRQSEDEWKADPHSADACSRFEHRSSLLAGCAIKHLPALLSQLDAQAAEIERLRSAMLSALSATRAKVDGDISTEWLCLGADEIRLCIRRMDQERAEQTARAERSIACGAEALNKLDAARLRASEQRIRADKAEARVVELEDILARICEAWCDEDCEFDVAGPRAIRDGRAALAKREGGR